MINKLFFGFSLLAGLSCASAKADLPTAMETYAGMGFGLNIGNTMEVPSDPTLWGNKFPTQQFVDSVKAAGFSTIRIPCAWDSHAQNGTINKSWMDSVQTVVDYCMRAG
ncbi:MAG: cellulase family glycosylhydrolase, partial [Fibrobacteraceae bacterium]